MAGTQDVKSRDAALRKLTRINRWLIAGSVTATGVLSAVAAQTFSGKTVDAASTTTEAGGSTTSGTARSTGSSSQSDEAARSSAKLKAAQAAPSAASTET